MEFHPAANAFPMMSECRFNELVEDIKKHGQREPITVCDGMILDGRNRYKACVAIGLNPSTREYSGNPWDFAWSLNGARRDLVDEQKYLIWKFCNENSQEWQAEKQRIADEANRKRSEAQVGVSKAEAKERARTECPNTLAEPGKRAKASASKTNAGAVARGDKLAKERPDLAKKVMSGEIKPAEAHRQLKKEKKIKEFQSLSQEYKEESGIEMVWADFRAAKIDAESIDAIITDPPYPEEYLTLWESMFEIAERVLKPSSFLVAYANHQNLDKIFRLKNNLKYYWTFKLDFTAKPIAMGRNLIATWKPVLVFQKLPFKKIETTIEDCIKETKKFEYSERDAHALNWGQSLGKVEWVIETFTKPNDLVFEPFAGTGTTLIACKNLKRRAIGFEIEKEQYEEIIKGRLVAGK